MKKCLVYLISPIHFVSAISAIKNYHNTGSEITILLYLDKTQYDSKNRNLFSIIKEYSRPYSNIKNIIILDKEEYKEEFLLDNHLAIQRILKTKTKDDFDEIYYSHDVVGNLYTALCRSYPEAARICYGDCLGTVYERQAHLAYVNVKSNKTPEYCKPDKVSLIIPIDYYGNFFDNVKPDVVPKQFSNEIIGRCLDTSKALSIYVEKLIKKFQNKDKILLLTENLAEANFITFNIEIEMLCAIIKQNTSRNSVVFIKSHPFEKYNRGQEIIKKLDKQVRIVLLDQKFKYDPIEFWQKLVKSCKVICTGYPFISLKYLYNVDAFNPFTDKFIEDWFPKRMWKREKNLLFRNNEQRNKLNTWNNKGLLWSGELGEVNEFQDTFFEKKINDKVNKIIESSKIIICGAGYHTQKLLEEYPILKSKILAISTNKKNSEKFLNISLIEEIQILNFDFEKIIISSNTFEIEIFKRLLLIGIPQEKIILLYNNKGVVFHDKQFLKKFYANNPENVFIPPNETWEKYSEFLKIHPSVIIDPSSMVNLCQIPGNPRICLEIGKESHIFSKFTLFRSEAKIIIGKRCQLGNVNFMAADGIQVHDDVLMAWGITVMDTNHHSLYWDERKDDVIKCRADYMSGNVLGASHIWENIECKKVIIEDKVWVGCDSTILKGVTIGEGAIIGSSSVVTKNVKSWHVGGGNPFKHIKKVPKKRIAENE
ncbi:MAG: thiogalactoside acetyltransferase [uncultured bacterium]|nr:MAG: thiogalactoside acetyltransferase [uncultured bacterium]